MAIDATLIKTSAFSKFAGYLLLKWMQWRKRILSAIKQFWQDNIITCSEFIWLEPGVLTYEVIDESRIKATKKAGISFNRSGKKINYKRTPKERRERK